MAASFDALTDRFSDAVDALVEQATRAPKLDTSNAKIMAFSSAIIRILLAGFKGKGYWIMPQATPELQADLWLFMENVLSSDSSITKKMLKEAAQLNNANGIDSFHHRFTRYTALALMNRSLGHHIQILSEAAALDTWYEQWSFICSSEHVAFIIATLKSLDAIDFNIELLSEVRIPKKQLKKSVSVSQIILGKGEMFVKSSLAATWRTLGQSGGSSNQSDTLNSDAMINSGMKTIAEESFAAQETLEKFVEENQSLHKEIERLQEALDAEKRRRLALEVELIAKKMDRYSRDNESEALRLELEHTKKLLSLLRLKPEAMRDEFVKLYDERNALTEELRIFKDAVSNPDVGLPMGVSGSMVALNA